MSEKYRCDGWVQHEWRSPEACCQHPPGVSCCYWHLVSHRLGKIYSLETALDVTNPLHIPINLLILSHLEN